MNQISNNSRLTTISDYLELINNLPGMIYCCKNDEFWTMKFINSRSVELTGFYPEELIDNQVVAYADLIFESDKKLVWEKVNEALEKKERYTITYRIITKNHEVKWVWEQGNGVWDTEGNLLFLEGIIIDISNQEAIKKELEKSEEKYRNIFENIVDVYYETSIDGKILEISPSVVNLLGFNREELIGKNVKLTYYDPEMREKMIETILKENKLNNYPLLLKSRSGEKIKVSLNVILKKSGDTSFLCGVIRDISAITKMEEELVKKEQHYHSLFINAPNPYFALNQDLMITEINSALLEMTGYRQEEMLFYPLINFLQEYEIPRLEILKEEIFKNGKIESIELDLKHKNGGIISVLLSGKSNYNDLKQSVEVQFIATNISQRKALEEELEKAKKRAEESDRIKSAFLANMSHEIRTPMNAIMGFSSLLKDKSLSDEERDDYINIILKRGNDLLQIISDIIDISRIEAGDIRLVFDKIHLNKFLTEIKDEYNKIKKLRGKDHIVIRNSFFPLDDDVYIETDKVRLNQIFQNLIGNALKFTHEGFIEFGYQVIPGFIEFYVKDTGIGIKESDHELIFERFRQANEKHTQEYGGTGLGLAIVKSLVSLLGGSISLESQPGVGSVFYFTVPFDIKNISVSSFNELKGIEQRKPDLHGLKVLIAEDEITNYHYLESVISRYGAKIIWANDGYTAIEIMKKHPEIRLILMDIKMPGIDGHLATKKIREFNKDVIIIAQTAYALKGDKEKAIESGCNDYIAKPVRLEILNQLLIKYFNKT